MKCVQNKVYPSETNLRNNIERNGVHVIRTTSATKVNKSTADIVLINVGAERRVSEITSSPTHPNSVEDKASTIAEEMKILTKLEEKITEKLTPRFQKGSHSENEALFNNSKNEQDTTSNEYIELNHYNNESTNEKEKLITEGKNKDEINYELRSLCGDEDPAYSCSQPSLRDGIIDTDISNTNADVNNINADISNINSNKNNRNSDLNNNSIKDLKNPEIIKDKSDVDLSYNNPTLERGDSLNNELELKYDNYISPEPGIIDESRPQNDDDAIELASLCEGENPSFSSSQALLRDEENDQKLVTETSFISETNQPVHHYGIPEEIPEENAADPNWTVGNTDGTPEHFFGSLGIQLRDGPWILDVDRELTADYEEEDWDAHICEKFASAKDVQWSSALKEIEADKTNVEKHWNATLNPISSNEGKNTTWRSEVENNIQNASKITDWKSNLNQIEKSSESKWSSSINDIAIRAPSKNEWKSKFNDMLKRTNVDSWTAKLPKTLLRGKENDWSSKFHTLEAPTLASDSWTAKIHNSFNIPVDDQSHYRNRLNSMASLKEEGVWGGSLKEINDRKNIDKNWRARLNEIKENTQPDTWKSNLSTIAKYEIKDRDWTAKMTEMIFDSNSAQRWKYEILNAHYPQGSTSWDYKQCDIAPRGDSHRWNMKIIEPDMSGMNHSKWENSFHPIKNAEDEPNWEVKGEMIEVMNQDVFLD